MAAIESQERQFDDIVQLNEPLTDFRDNSLAELDALLGLSGEGDAEAALAALRASPGFQFSQDETTRAVEGSRAAAGGLFSGGTLQELQDRQLALGDLTFNNRVSQLLQGAGLGVAGTQTVSNAAFNTGQGVAQSLANIGAANAAGTIGSANAIAGGVNNAAFLAGLLRNQNQPQSVFTPSVSSERGAIATGGFGGFNPYSGAA
ncbi:MAG: hypothetical protein AAFN78_01010 [Pseudomonadota bacterium]